MSGANDERENNILSVQLTTSRKGLATVPPVDAQSAVCDDHAYTTQSRMLNGSRGGEGGACRAAEGQWRGCSPVLHVLYQHTGS